MRTKKVTISLEAGELAWIEAHARREHQGNVSAAFVDGVHALKRQAALRDFLRLSRAPVLSPDELATVIAEIRGVDSKVKRRTRSRRAA